MTDEEIQQLKAEVESLRNDLDPRLPQPEAIAELKAAIVAIGDKITLSDRIAKLEQEQTKYVSANEAGEIRTSLSAVEEKIALREKFFKLERTQERWKIIGTCLSIIFIVFGPILGVFGYKTLNQFIHAQVKKRMTFYSDLSAGLTYIDKYPGSAIPYLMRCYNQSPWEEPIVGPFYMRLTRRTIGTQGKPYSISWRATCQNRLVLRILLRVTWLGSRHLIPHFPTLSITRLRVLRSIEACATLHLKTRMLIGIYISTVGGYFWRPRMAPLRRVR